MAELVGALALSHGSSIVSQPQRVSTDVRSGVYGALEQARERLVAMAPDAIVIIGTDHFNTFFVDDLPPVCVGVGDAYRGWADNMPMYTVPGSVRASEQLLAGLPTGVRSQADMRLDHSFLGPLHFLTPAMDVPILPIFQNCIADPMPTPEESAQFGAQLASAIDAITEWERVVLVGSGGLSHWLGGPEHTRVDDTFDHRFLTAFQEGDLTYFNKLDSSEIEDLAGNGGHEIRNWLTVRACAPEFDVDVIYYRPIREWIVGFAVTALHPGAAA